MGTFTIGNRFPKGNAHGIRLGSIPEAFRCRATSKGTGRPCQCVAVKGRGLCKHHGGKRQGDMPSPHKLKRLAAILNGVR